MKYKWNCYAASEALYHVLGGKNEGWKPMRMKHEGISHWFILNVKTGQVVDPTVKQFRTPPNYSTAIGCGFLTRHPSKRARDTMRSLLWR